MVRLFILAMFLVALGGCGLGQKSATFIPATPPATKITTPELVRDLAQENKDLGSHLDTMEKAIKDIPDANPVKAVLLADFMPLPIDWSKMNVTLGDTTKSVAADVVHTQKVEKENVQLKADDPARAEFRNYGILFVIAGIVGLLASLFAASIPVIGPFLTKLGGLLTWGSLVTIGIGLVLITVAHFLNTIYDIVFWTGIAAALGVAVIVVVKLVKVHWQLSAILGTIVSETQVKPEVDDVQHQ